MDLIRRIRPKRTGVRAPLGHLEMEVMRYIWPCGEAGCLAIEVQQSLEQSRPIALTTVLTTLDRLDDKGILRREKEGRAYRYSAVLSEEQLQARIVEGVLGDLISQFPQAVAAYFAQQDRPDVSPSGDEALALEALSRRLEAARDDRPKEPRTAEESQPEG